MHFYGIWSHFKAFRGAYSNLGGHFLLKKRGADVLSAGAHDWTSLDLQQMCLSTCQTQQIWPTHVIHHVLNLTNMETSRCNFRPLIDHTINFRPLIDHTINFRPLIDHAINFYQYSKQNVIVLLKRL
jgi:hypothetical protein